MKKARPERTPAPRARDEQSKSGGESKVRRGSKIGRVLVLADGAKPEVRELLVKLKPWIESRAELHVEDDLRAFTRPNGEPHGPRPDLVVVLGGDGAILGAVRLFAEDPVQTLGINFGRVGFLTSAEASHWEEVLEGIFSGPPLVEPRMRLEATLIVGGKQRARAVALNDIVLTRGAFQGLLELSMAVDGKWVTNYRADGLIVATPSGSTAYSLAAGGPILAPEMQGIVVTPVCPQSLTHRPIVLQPNAELVLSLSRSSGITTLVVDGQGFYSVQQGDEVRLKRHPVPYPLLVQPGLDPYRRLRDRLGWKGSFDGEEHPQQGREVEPGEDGVL